MPMTVEARLNIGAAPQAPLFLPNGNVLYRASFTDLRKASFQTLNDVLFTGGMSLGGGAPGVIVGLQAGRYYVGTQSCVGGGGQPTMEFVDLVTAAVTSILLTDPGPGHDCDGSAGVINAGAASRVGVKNSTGGNPVMLWSLLPPAAGMFSDSSSVASGNHIWSRSNFNGFARLAGFRAATVSPYWENYTIRPPANAAALAGMVPNVDGIYTPLGYTGNNPWGMIEYAGYAYGFFTGRNAGQEYPGIFRYNMSTGVFQTQMLDTINPRLAGSVFSNFRIDLTFGRIYWSFSNLGFLISGASLNAWPIAGIDTVLVDTGNNGANCVRGLYTEPPYIYALKSTGPTYGNQYIRIFDTELSTAHHPKKRGGELWDLVPDVAHYISP